MGAAASQDFILKLCVRVYNFMVFNLVLRGNYLKVATI